MLKHGNSPTMIFFSYNPLFITNNSNHPKYQPITCHGQWTMDYDAMMDSGQEWVEHGWVTCGWAWHRRGPCVTQLQPI